MSNELSEPNMLNSAQDLLDKFDVICGNMLQNFQNEIAVSSSDIADLLQLTQMLQTCAANINCEELSILFINSINYINILVYNIEKFDRDDLELLGSLEVLLHKTFSFSADLLSDELITEITNVNGLIASRVCVVSEPQELAMGEELSMDDVNTAEIANVEQEIIEVEQPNSYENSIFIKYQNRAERYFVALYPAATFATIDDFSNSEYVDNISRIGDIILKRVYSCGALLLFSAELDAEIITSLAGAAVVELTKDPALLGMLESPWNQIVFDLNAPLEEIDANAQNAISDDLNGNTLVNTVSDVPAQATVAPAEDFDSKNANTIYDPNLLDAELLQDFLSNADELLDKLSQSILDLESNPSSTESIEQIFRTAHTIKGTAGMFGFKAIERLTHVMENLFDKVRKGMIVATSAHIDGILFGFDRVKAMFNELKANRTPELAINDALARLDASLRGESLPPVARVSASASESTASIQSVSEVASIAPKAAAPAAAKTENSGTIRVDLKRLDSLVNLVGELVIDRTRFIQIEEELRGRSENSDLLHAMSESVLLFGRHMNEVQSIIMKIRMVPVGNAFVKFSRVVRDLAKDCGKEIDLNIEGGDSELDKTLVEEIGDPLIHLIRNSIDHGIELPEDRLAAGKKRRGNINIRAYQDSNMIVISISDDGKGLQLEKIRKKGIQNGLIKENDVLTNKEIFGLIFEAGFSTAEQVTNISGRGVGMDVVKKAIIKLKGIIDLDSTLGQRTTVTIKLPLTLAIIPSLMVEVSGESYAIPLVNVIESIRISPAEIQRIGSADFVKLRERALSLRKLSDIFELNTMDTQFWYRSSPTSSITQQSRGSPAAQNAVNTTLANRDLLRQRQKQPRLIFVVVGVGEKRLGIIVDQLLGQQEIVIKSLGKILGKPDGVAGGCVLGNGRVALVLDVGEIVENVCRVHTGANYV